MLFPKTSTRSSNSWRDRKFPVDQAVSLVVPLDEAADALRSWSQNPSQFKKIMVSLDSIR